MFKIKLSEVIKVWFSFIPKSKYHTSDIQTYQWMTEDLLAHSDDRVWFYKTRDSDLVPGPLRLQCQWHDIRLSECENLRRENFWITQTICQVVTPLTDSLRAALDQLTDLAWFRFLACLGFLYTFGDYLDFTDMWKIYMYLLYFLTWNIIY